MEETSNQLNIESEDGVSRTQHQTDKYSSSHLGKSLAMVHTRTVVGVAAKAVVVEVHLANGLPAFSTVGLPEAAVKESKDRVRGAILNSGFEFPAKRITVNLSPADLPKTGSRFDLPIAIGILAASGQLPGIKLEQHELVGELALDGRLRRITGVLPTVMAALQDDRQLICPHQNAAEAALVREAESCSAAHLLDVCHHLIGQQRLETCCTDASPSQQNRYSDILDVKGQAHAKRALEIAASGGHSLLFIGPPGTGKSMLASRLPGIMPPLTNQQALEAAAIRSIVNDEDWTNDWMYRPFRSPHHSASSAALVGGGTHPRPGEISLAHQGILFLDELTEFSRATLEQLREPLETGVVNIARAAQSVQYPAEFLLVAACNPCKCGYLDDGTDRCQCSATSIENYRAKLSGPLLDRIDMHVHLPRVSARELQSSNTGEASATVRRRVEESFATQVARQGVTNAKLAGSLLDKICELDQTTQSFLQLACDRLQLSARAYHRILRLARTIADMDKAPMIQQCHIGEAIGLRTLDRGR